MAVQSWRRLAGIVVSGVLAAAALSAQTAPPPTQTPIPRPTPFPGSTPPPTTPKPADPAPKPATPAPTPTQSPNTSAACATVDPATLDPLMAGIPVYPCAVYLETFDAGPGQRLFAFGTNDAYVEVVGFYKTQLKKSGEELSKLPAIHQFERGTFDSSTMAQRPGIVVKDYAWPAVTDAYLHVSGTTGTRYRTIIQIIPASK